MAKRAQQESGEGRGQGDGVPKECLEQAAADSRGSRTCVCASTYQGGWHETAECTVRPTSRAGKVLRPPIRALPSVIVDTEKVLREADGPEEM